MSNEDKDLVEDFEDSDYDSVFEELTREDGEEALDEEDTSEDQEQQAEETDEQEEPKDETSSTDDWKDLYEREVQRTRSWDGRLRAADQRIKELEDQLQKKEIPSEKEVYEATGDEDDVIKSFVEEFPDLEKPLSLMISKKAKELAESVVNERFNEFTPIKKTVEKQMADNHLRAISTAHPDWKQIVESGSVKTWIESQPEYLQGPLARVYREGSTDEVIDLLTRFKSSTEEYNSVSSTQAKNKRSKISSVVAVPTGRANPPKREHDPNDFDGTWERITKT